MYFKIMKLMEYLIHLNFFQDDLDCSWQTVAQSPELTQGLKLPACKLRGFYIFKKLETICDP